MGTPSASRRIELSQALPASSADAWATLTDLEGWPRWGRLVTAAQGELIPGAVWRMTLRGVGGGPPRTMRPTLLRVEAPSVLEFETRIGAAWVARMTHAFALEATGPDSCVLRQSFAITGLLVAPLWRWLEPGMRQFDALGQDLARALAEATAPPSSPPRAPAGAE